MQVPFIAVKTTVPSQWIDVNGHMNATHYGLIVYEAHFNFTQEIGLGDDYVKETDFGKVVLESHMIYEQEVSEGDELEIRSWLLAVDAKRLHFFYEMYNLSKGHRAAAAEQVDIHVDLNKRLSAPLPEKIYEELKERVAANLKLPTPHKVGSTIRAPKNNWLRTGLSA